MKKWKSNMKMLEILINDAIDNYERRAGIVMLEDMKDMLEEAIQNRRSNK